MYRCAKCGEPISNESISNDTNGQSQCYKCKSWIFVKERPIKKKTLQSD